MIAKRYKYRPKGFLSLKLKLNCVIEMKITLNATW